MSERRVHGIEVESPNERETREGKRKIAGGLAILFIGLCLKLIGYIVAIAGGKDADAFFVIGLLATVGGCIVCIVGSIQCWSARGH